MNSKKPEPPITPGIREALHPGLGNGAALEAEKHAFLLRVPDPAKYLESYFGLAPEPLQSLDTSSQMHAENQEPERNQFSEERPEVPEYNDKGKLKGTPKNKPEKAQKLGKRLKKAIKSTEKEEASPPLPQLNIMARQTESTLSPFTLWLKGLSGSEYVHPYDDDFALRHEAPAAGEGISETYADLLAAQGYKDQAIEMYKRLMEKYPEKSGFFAAKIEALS